MKPDAAELKRPSLRRDLLLAKVEPDELYVFGERRVWLWKAHALVKLLPLLDGTRTLTQLLQETSTELSAFEVMYFLNELRDEGLVVDNSPDGRVIAEADLVLWDSLRATMREAPDGPGSWSVSLQVLGDQSSRDDLLDAFGQFAISIDGVRQCNLHVVLTDDYLRPELAEANATALASGRPWMICRLIGQTAWVGPIFRPDHTGCLVCMQHRLRLNRQVEDFVARHAASFQYGMPASTHPAAVRLASLVAAQEIALWLGGRTDRLEGRLLSVSTRVGQLENAHHNLVRRPQCPACGTPRLAWHDAPIEIEQAFAVPHVDGSRAEAADDTLSRLRRHVDPLLGVVTWIRKLPQGGESLVHNFAAGHNFSFGPDSAYWLRKSISSRTGGKGTTETEAEVSALGEAIERYAGVFRGEEARVRSTLAELGGAAIHPNECMGFSRAQYEGRDVDGAHKRDFFHAVPKPFPEDRAIEWSPLWSLTSRETKYLPTAYCYYGHPDADEHFYCFADGNGCAAGTMLEEAILHAFLELVERDSAAIWWYNQIARPAVDWESFQNPYVERVADYCERIGRQFWMLDLTTDTSVPVFAAVSRRTSGPAEDMIFGFGAHLSPSKALVHACTEHNQFLPAVFNRDGTGSTVYEWPDLDALRFWQSETIASQPQLAPASHLPRRQRGDFVALLANDFASDLSTCQEIVRKLGLEMLVLDQSRPDIDVRVARVVVPGMRHFWRRLGPGRLFDVPVRLGWRTRQTPESEMNAVSIFF
jgi:bacteriocin biosynthesis cyclodehydratase domain-containing protein